MREITRNIRTCDVSYAHRHTTQCIPHGMQHFQHITKKIIKTSRNDHTKTGSASNDVQVLLNQHRHDTYMYEIKDERENSKVTHKHMHLSNAMKTIHYNTILAMNQAHRSLETINFCQMLSFFENSFNTQRVRSRSEDRRARPGER